MTPTLFPRLLPQLQGWLRAFLPSRTAIPTRERLRACLGALLGILLTGLISMWWLGPQAAPSLIAPMGASAVLLFVLPASPLAQPWSILGGNTVSALIGTACAVLIPGAALAAAVAVGLSIFAMLALRCVHPPSGAVALTAVLGGPTIHALGFGFAWVPVGLNSLALVSVALIYNQLSGRRYPHTQQLVVAPSPMSMERMGFELEDLKFVLDAYDQVLDISADDLAELFRRTEAHAFQRRHQE